MSRNIRTRLVRLERDGPAADSDGVPPYFWEVISGAKNAADLPSSDRTRLEDWWDFRREESQRCRVSAVQRMLDALKTEIGQIPKGVSPSAEELVEREDRERGFCTIEELLRLLSSPQKTER